MMYPNYVLGFHGCEKQIAEKVLLGKSELKQSKNKYDWLGSGIYFWENDFNRALEYAKELQKEEPFVIGAIINLGHCLDLTQLENVQLLKIFYDNVLKGNINLLNKKGKRGGVTGDLMLRDLDCAVINGLHQFNEENKFSKFDSVRAAFWEGNDLYDTAGFKEKNHIQICVRNPQNIIGYFLPQKIRQQIF